MPITNIIFLALNSLFYLLSIIVSFSVFLNILYDKKNKAALVKIINTWKILLQKLNLYSELMSLLMKVQ